MNTTVDSKVIVKPVPVWVDCPGCEQKAGFVVRTTEGGVKVDVYACENGHEHRAPVSA